MEKANYLSRENNKLKSSKWDQGTNVTFERDLACGFSWPPKNYRCSFCKKEFRSAQALGGHMNVHRRDRAKLRQSSSWDFPNPNPNFSSSASNQSITCSSSYVSPFYDSNPSAAGNDHSVWVPLHNFKNNKMGGFLEVQAGLKGIVQEKDHQWVSKKRELLGLDSDIEARSVIQDLKEDLDLELRLGYS